MKLLMIGLLASVAVLLAGCGPIYETHYDYKAPHSETGKMCTNQCLQAKSQCEQMNGFRHDTCVSQARQEASVQFQAYSAQRIASHQPVNKTVSSFDESYSRCSSSSSANANCATDYNVCYQNCGGVVKTTKICTAFCDKK